MTDTEIIQAFLTNNQQGIRWAYDAWQSSFRYSVLSRTHIDEDYIEVPTKGLLSACSSIF